MFVRLNYTRVVFITKIRQYDLAFFYNRNSGLVYASFDLLLSATASTAPLRLLAVLRLALALLTLASSTALCPSVKTRYT